MYSVCDSVMHLCPFCNRRTINSLDDDADDDDDDDDDTRNSAKLTNQRVSYAFTSSPFSIHVHHILPTSKFQHSYSRILLISISVNSMCENCDCEYSSLV